MALVASAAEDASYPDFRAALRELVKPYDGIVLGTPEYQGSFNEVLKNALDLTGGWGGWSMNLNPTVESNPKRIDC